MLRTGPRATANSPPCCFTVLALRQRAVPAGEVPGHRRSRESRSPAVRGAAPPDTAILARPGGADSECPNRSHRTRRRHAVTSALWLQRDRTRRVTCSNGSTLRLKVEPSTDPDLVNRIWPVRAIGGCSNCATKPGALRTRLPSTGPLTVPLCAWLRLGRTTSGAGRGRRRALACCFPTSRRSS